MIEKWDPVYKGSKTLGTCSNERTEIVFLRTCAGEAEFIAQQQNRSAFSKLRIVHKIAPTESARAKPFLSYVLAQSLRVLLCKSNDITLNIKPRRNKINPGAVFIQGSVSLLERVSTIMAELSRMPACPWMSVCLQETRVRRIRRSGRFITSGLK